MQLATLYCETVGRVCCANKSVRSPIKSSAAEDSTSPKKVMSCSNERKRKHLHNSSNSEYDSGSEDAERFNSARTQQKHHENNRGLAKEENDRDTMKNNKSRKIPRSPKILTYKCKETNASESNSPNSKDNETESERGNETAINELDSQVHEQTVPFESKYAVPGHENGSEDIEKPINSDVKKEKIIIFQERPEDFSNIPKDISTIRKNTMEQCDKEVGNRSPSVKIPLTEKVTVRENDEKIFAMDDLNKVSGGINITDDNKTNLNQYVDNTFLAQNNCDASLYDIQKMESSTSLAAVVSSVEQSSPKIDEKHILRNFESTSELNHKNMRSNSTSPLNGCTNNSKLIEYRNTGNEVATTNCRSVNVTTIAEKEKSRISDQKYEYKNTREIEKSFVETEESISTKSWEPVSHNNRFENVEALCFRTSTNHNSAIDINQRNPQLEIYGGSYEDYNVHSHQRLSGIYPNSIELTERNTESDNISLPEERNESLVQPEQYRQFQHHDQQPIYDQILEVHRREQQHQLHTQQQRQQQQQYPQEFYQMRLQQQHHQLASVMPMLPQLHPDHGHDDNFMAYSHHQHPGIPTVEQHNRLQQDIYHNLVMDEFHEETNPSAFKLPISPTTKHENQDDGYETSAGDVLTPNSHSSSTHSGTPQITGSLQVPTSALALQSIPTPKCVPGSQSTQIHTLQCLSPENYKQDGTNLNNTAYNRFRKESNIEQNIDRVFNIQQDQQQQSPQNQNPPSQSTHEGLLKPPQKKRGRKKKIPLLNADGTPVTQSVTDINETGTITITKTKERKKHDRFNGMTEEEVVKRTLPDHLCHNLDIVIIGINPGLFAAYKGHHYAGPGNHFWKCLYLSGLTQEQMSADEDFKLMKYGIGFTNMVQRATKGSADLTRKEIKEGSRILLEKLQRFQPKIAVFNGKLIFEVFSGKKDFNFGRQPEYVEGTNTYVWVMPSSSARCAQLPRAADKVPFYAALKKFRDYLNGMISHIDEEECVFTEQRIRQMCEQEHLKSLTQSQIVCGYSNVSDGTTASSKKQEQVQSNAQLQKGDYSLYSPSDNQIEPNTENISESTIGGPGPPTMISQSGGFVVPSNFSGPTHQPPEKKKRGRPKKLRIQELIDPNTGQKIQISTPPQGQQHNVNSDYTNILNLSMIPGEVPKKKRGRPKKIKPLSTDMLQASSCDPTPMRGSHNPNTNSMSIQSLTVSNVLTQQVSQQHSLYTSPGNTNLQGQLYTGDCSSPIGSPALNSKTGGGTSNSSLYNNVGATPPINIASAQNTPQINDGSVEVTVNSNKQHLGESPPSPTSPNICAVDFEPPNTTAAHHQEPHELQQPQIPSLSQQQDGRFESSHINRIDGSSSENFQQWMSTSQQFNYQSSQHQEQHMQQYHDDQHLSIHLRQQQQISHENNSQTQHSPHSSWGATQIHQNFDTNDVSHQQSQYLIHHHNHQQQEQQRGQPQLHHQTIPHSSDVSTKSLSGLESLVDQIPTIAESEAAAAAVESRLQALQRGSTPGTLGELQNEPYTGSLNENRTPACLGSTASLTEVTNDTTTSGRNSSNSSNTPHYNINGGVSCASPIANYGIQRQSQTTSAASSPHANSQYSSGVSSGTNFSLSNATEHSSGVTGELLTSSNTPPMIASSSTTTTNNNNSTTTSHLFSNFSVSHLAASSCNNSSNNKSAEWPPNNATSPYHHPNLMAAAALQLHSAAAAASSSPTGNPPHQMYIEHPSIHHHPHHTHLSSPHQHHVQVNSLYSPTTQGSHAHHHPGMAVAYGPPHTTSQHPSHHIHNASSEFGTYGATAAAAAAHMLHMPNPNYSPYGYGTPPPPPVPTATAQSNYSSWNHHHPSAPSHHPHHLSMFERLKPSDISSYSSF